MINQFAKPSLSNILMCQLIPICLDRPEGREVRGERTHSPRSQKGPPDGIVKYLCFKTTLWWQTLTISMHFYQSEDFKFLIFVRGACPRIPEDLRVSNRSDFTCESQILTRRHSRAAASTRRTKEIASVKLLSLHVIYFLKLSFHFYTRK